MIYILGGAGFVGSAFTRYCLARSIEHRAITRATYGAFRGTTCDLLIDASGNSRKYLADRDPIADFDHSVRQVAMSLEAFTAHTYVLISSGDVYEDPSTEERTREDRDLDIAGMSRYGQHKFLAEQLVIARHPNWLIIRPGGFVGPGLWKNAIFDILTGGKVWLSPASELQFLHTDRAAALVMALVGTGIRRQIVNLGGRGTVRLGALHATAHSTSVFIPAAPTVAYKLSLERLTRLAPIEVPHSDAAVREFAAGWPQSGARHLR